MTERVSEPTIAAHQQVIEMLNDIMQLNLTYNTQDIERNQVEQWDSVNHLHLVMELEQTFNIELSDEDVLGMQSLRQIESVLEQHGVDGVRSGEN